VRGAVTASTWHDRGLSVSPLALIGNATADESRGEDLRPSWGVRSRLATTQELEEMDRRYIFLLR
jgi:hypothetical protein